MRSKRPGHGKKGEKRSAEDFVREIKKKAPTSSRYREQSLKIHGLICAKCAKEYSDKDAHMLTVHHKDGDRSNNPPDGSNWENLCIYCHDDEHSREILGEYFADES
ncbi:MAG TPA: HNH nuclease family protein [Nitrospirae bacterium]|nr:hypothetical protein BMS3Abin10_00151 [bacterium BMS3Abin10]GBE39336.1 hypothetical protein BMS3Bbin08_01958 [bacterium BMS3Bbin08]HDH51681.1 HNH nuclease family protein [Nitrospirota bacterium]HDK17346.1 HNH nuclease family protein [Nitrospirota bacterium]HDO25206.1 HNH nuclease family protein [Nitrospirota bacterium]